MYTPPGRPGQRRVNFGHRIRLGAGRGTPVVLGRRSWGAVGLTPACCRARLSLSPGSPGQPGSVAAVPFVGSPGQWQGGRRPARSRALYQALTVAGLSVAVLAGSTPSDAATIAQRVATLAGPRSAAGNELAAGTQLKGGSRLESPNGRYRLAMQADGNLVLYGEGHPLWASGTAGHPGAFLVMQGDGNLVVYQANRPIWSRGPTGAAVPPTT